MSLKLKGLFLFVMVFIFSFQSNNDLPQTGTASYYSDKLQGKKTSSGELYNKFEFTAAHRTLPFGTKLLVTNLLNNLAVVVKVNDRGPYSKGRLIDVSRAAAQQLGMTGTGVAKVKIEFFSDDLFLCDSSETDLITDSMLSVHDSILKNDVFKNNNGF